MASTTKHEATQVIVTFDFSIAKYKPEHPWGPKSRRVLVRTPPLMLYTIVKGMLEDRMKGKAMQSLCKEVLDEHNLKLDLTPWMMMVDDGKPLRDERDYRLDYRSSFINPSPGIHDGIYSFQKLGDMLWAGPPPPSISVRMIASWVDASEFDGLTFDKWWKAPASPSSDPTTTTNTAPPRLSTFTALQTAINDHITAGRFYFPSATPGLGSLSFRTHQGSPPIIRGPWPSINATVRFINRLPDPEAQSISLLFPLSLPLQSGGIGKHAPALGRYLSRELLKKCEDLAKKTNSAAFEAVLPLLRPGKYGQGRWMPHLFVQPQRRRGAAAHESMKLHYFVKGELWEFLESAETWRSNLGLYMEVHLVETDERVNEVWLKEKERELAEENECAIEDD